MKYLFINSVAGFGSTGRLAVESCRALMAQGHQCVLAYGRACGDWRIQMKYLFINSVAGFGSTGRLAVESCRALMAQGHQCVLAYGRACGDCADVPTVRIGSDLACRIHGLESRLLDDQGFGSRLATRRFLKWVEAYDPDVVWLHNLHGYYLNLPQLFAYLRRRNKRVVWTLHDCWAFTGHCAYFDYVQCQRWKPGCHHCPEKHAYPKSLLLDGSRRNYRKKRELFTSLSQCQRWKPGCHHCPEKHAYPKSLLLDGSRRNYRKKRELFTSLSQMELIVPSHWLERRVKQSFLGQYPVQVRYHQVDRTIFRPRASTFRQDHHLEGKTILLGVASVWDRRKGLSDFLELAGQVDRTIFRPRASTFRQDHHLEGKTILLGVASVWDRRKGLSDFLELAGMLEERYAVVLVGLNPQQRQNLPENVLALPRTATVEALAEIYSAADLFLNPSVEETFGMTVLEAQCCGTPAVVYADTACEEVAQTFGGLAVPRGAENLLEAVHKLTKEPNP